MKKYTTLLGLLLLLLAAASEAAPLYEERPYEPFVRNGGEIGGFLNVPVDEIFVFAYRQASDTWEMIPFQIDERIRLRDPFPYGKPEEKRQLRHFYINENTSFEEDYSFQDTLYMAQNQSGGWVTLFDIDDELVFMIGDMGDQAPEGSEIDDPEARDNDRLEIKLSDPLDPLSSAYVYLFRSSTLQMPDEVRHKYGMAFDPLTHTAESNAYSMTLHAGAAIGPSEKANGLVKDIVIKPPFGSGVDIFDRQKMRFNGSFLIENVFGEMKFGTSQNTPSAQEDAFILYENDDYLSYTRDPVVRVVREGRYALLLKYPLLAFYVRTKFYPYSGTIEGGAGLDPQELYRVFGVEMYVTFDYMRQSWDFSPAAGGMRFYNRNNPQGLLVDGVPDTPDTTIDIPIEEWSMLTGDQGTMVSFTRFDETNWKSVSLYYHDSQSGGVADTNFVVGKKKTSTDPEVSDSGDMLSYGDHGISFISLAPNSPINLELDYTAYFLAANAEPALAEKIVGWIQNPVNVNRRLISEVDGQSTAGQPHSFELLPVYPNPFNPSTTVRFRLSRHERAIVRIFDLHGRVVCRLADRQYSSGLHELSWDGRNDSGQPVSSGLYVVRVETADQSRTQKMVLLK